VNANIPTREEAFRLLTRYNQNDALIKHALAVEGVMRYFARQRGEDEEKWGIIGLIHDLDYEKYPDEHCRKTEEILTENEWPHEYIRAVKGQIRKKEVETTKVRGRGRQVDH